MHSPAIARLASQMGVTYNDALSFLAGVQIWMNKGMDFEAAVERHMQVLREGAGLLGK